MTTTSNPVASTEFAYHVQGLVDSIHHVGLASGSTFEEEHLYGYDNGQRLTEYSNLIDDVLTQYGYDYRDQLTSAEDQHSVLPDESYAYDINGNREMVDNFAGAAQNYDVGVYNRLESDGTYTYEYDAEGNLVYRYQ